MSRAHTVRIPSNSKDGSQPRVNNATNGNECTELDIMPRPMARARLTVTSTGAHAGLDLGQSWRRHAVAVAIVFLQRFDDVYCSILR